MQLNFQVFQVPTTHWVIDTDVNLYILIWLKLVLKQFNICFYFIRFKSKNSSNLDP